MRLLLIANNYPLSDGTSTWAPFCIGEMARALMRAGATVHVVAPDHEGRSEYSDGVTVTRIPWSGRHEMDLMSLKLRTPQGMRHAMSLIVNGTRTTVSAIDGFRPDFAFAAWALPSGAFAWVGQRRRKIPYAVWCLGSDIHTWGRKPVLRAATRRVLADAVLCYADGFELAREAERIGGRPCGFLPTTRALVHDEREAPKLDLDKRHFLFVGRWEPVKGLDVLLESWRRLIESMPEKACVLHVVGQGSTLVPLVRNFGANPRLADSLVVHGWVSKEALAGLYAAVDVVVIPSRQESIPVVLSEALACGRSLIVTDVGDMGEIVRRYGLGIVVPPEDAAALDTALRQMLTAAHKTDDESLRAAQALFDIDRGARGLLNAVDTALSAGRRVGGRDG